MTESYSSVESRVSGPRFSFQTSLEFSSTSLSVPPFVPLQGTMARVKQTMRLRSRSPTPPLDSELGQGVEQMELVEESLPSVSEVPRTTTEAETELELEQPAGPTKKAEKFYDPRMCGLNQSCHDLYASKVEETRRTIIFGPGYDVRVPKVGSNVRVLPEGCIPVYEAVLDLGLRFPLHPFVLEILDGYDLGLWQLTPNSWANIFGYMATCELKGYHMSFHSFAHMHFLIKVGQSCDAWYFWSTRPSFLMTTSKSNKWKDWRNRFLYIKLDDISLCRRLNRANPNPYLCGRDADLPPTHPLDDEVLNGDHFRSHMVMISIQHLVI